jgi:hypothetical protein
MSEILSKLSSQTWIDILSFLGTIFEFILTVADSLFTSINAIVVMGSDSMSYIFDYLNSNSGVITLVNSAWDVVPDIFTNLLVASLIIMASFGFLRNL